MSSFGWNAERELWCFLPSYCDEYCGMISTVECAEKRQKENCTEKRQRLSSYVLTYRKKYIKREKEIFTTAKRESHETLRRPAALPIFTKLPCLDSHWKDPLIWERRITAIFQRPFTAGKSTSKSENLYAIFKVIQIARRDVCDSGRLIFSAQVSRFDRLRILRWYTGVKGYHPRSKTARQIAPVPYAIWVRMALCTPWSD